MVLFIPYVIAWHLVVNLRDSRLALAIVLCFAVLFGVTLLATYPGGSADVFQYIFQGRALALYHANPFLVAPRDLPGEDVVHYLFWVDETSTYGPFWVLLSGVAAFLAPGNLALSLLVFKGLNVLLYLLTTITVYFTLRRTHSDNHLSGTLFFAWNPLVVFEAIVNGHNDIAMALLAILAIYFLVAGRIRLSLVLLLGSVLIKFITLFLLPAFVLTWVRSGESKRARLRQAAEGTAMAFLLALVLYGPLWQGLQTIGPLRRSGLSTSSPSALVVFMLQSRGIPDSVSQLAPTIGWLTFIAVAAILMLRMRGGIDSLLTGSFDLLFAYFLLAATWFWPWYLIPLICVAATLTDRMRHRLALVFSGSALLKYAVLTLLWTDLGPLRAEALTTLAVFVPPLLFLCLYRLINNRRSLKAEARPFAT